MKKDIVDFGAELLEEESFNNLLDEEGVNALYPGLEPGMAGVNIFSFSILDSENKLFLEFDDGGTENNRLRTRNTKLSRWDSKVLASDDGTEYQGYIYSNSVSDPSVCFKLHLLEDDIVTIILGSNGGAATYAVESQDKELTKIYFDGKHELEKKKFYAKKSGVYKLYSMDDKLVVARIVRQRANTIKIDGKIDYIDVNKTGKVLKEGAKLDFLNLYTGKHTQSCLLSDNKYEVDLIDGMDYKLSFDELDDFRIIAGDLKTSDRENDRDRDRAASEADSVTEDKNIKSTFEANSYDVCLYEGHIRGLAAKELAKLKIDTESDSAYKAYINIDEDGTYKAYFERSWIYKLKALGVDDYDIKTTIIEVSGDQRDFDIEFEAKAKWPVEITCNLDKSYKDLLLEDENFKLVFTMLNDRAYTYEFGLKDEVMLRDGGYEVGLKGLNAYKLFHDYEAHLRVDSKAQKCNINIKKVDQWNFSKLNHFDTYEEIDDKVYYAGLLLDGFKINKSYLRCVTSAGQTGMIKISDCKVGDIVCIKYAYRAALAFPDAGLELRDSQKCTTKVNTFNVEVKKDGDFRIETIADPDIPETYLYSIAIKRPSLALSYKEEISVGEDKEYRTINQALDAVRHMIRLDKEPVRIRIDAGNYEEMLVIDEDNVHLYNACDKPNTDLINKGVDIKDGAVRITSYYGYGYSYYSMGRDCKYSDEALRINKANACPGIQNPGSGIGQGSYWNATVVVHSSGFEASNVIFENSYNQYVSEKFSQDIVMVNDMATGLSAFGERLSKEKFSTDVQDYSFLERAAALALVDGLDEICFDKCSFVSRQDTLFGGIETSAFFKECKIYGSIDYIFGGMKAVFYKCELVSNTSDDDREVFYISAPQQNAPRGYFFDRCHVRATKALDETASILAAKPGYFARPWKAETSEAVFYKTEVDLLTARLVAEDSSGLDQVEGEKATDGHDTCDGRKKIQSLIYPEAFSDSLGGESAYVGDYMTKMMGDDLTKRASFAAGGQGYFKEPESPDKVLFEIESFIDPVWCAKLRERFDLLDE